MPTVVTSSLRRGISPTQIGPELSPGGRGRKPVQSEGNRHLEPRNLSLALGEQKVLLQDRPSQEGDQRMRLDGRIQDAPLGRNSIYERILCGNRWVAACSFDRAHECLGSSRCGDRSRARTLSYGTRPRRIPSEHLSDPHGRTVTRPACTRVTLRASPDGARRSFRSRPGCCGEGSMSRAHSVRASRARRTRRPTARKPRSSPAAARGSPAPS